MLRRKVLLLLIAITALFSLPPLFSLESARAADCTVRACIDVYTHDGQIIIEGKKGSGSAQRKKTRPSARATKPVPPAPSRQPLPGRSRVPVPHRPPRPVVKKKIVPKVSLSDRLIKLLPVAKIGHQPATGALIHVPVIFWCDLPTNFTARVPILGEVIDVAMRPSFLWSFGDGAFYLTTEPGAPYPRQMISHRYSSPGRYVVTLLATWGGTWSRNGVSRLITGEIRQLTVAIADVEAAPTVITK